MDVISGNDGERGVTSEGFDDQDRGGGCCGDNATVKRDGDANMRQDISRLDERLLPLVLDVVDQCIFAVDPELKITFLNTLVCFLTINFFYSTIYQNID